MFYCARSLKLVKMFFALKRSLFRSLKLFSKRMISRLKFQKNELIAVIREHHCLLPESLRQTLDVDMSSAQQYMPRAATVVTTEVGQYPPSAPSPQSLINRKRPASEMIPELRQTQQPSSVQSHTAPVNQTEILAKVVFRWVKWFFLCIWSTWGPSANTCSLQTTKFCITKKFLIRYDCLEKAKYKPLQSPVRVKHEPSYKADPTLFDVSGRDLRDDEIKRPTSLTFAEGVNASTTYSTLSNSGVPITTPSNLIGGGTVFKRLNISSYSGFQNCCW